VKKTKEAVLKYNPDDLLKDQDLLDCISLVTAVFLSAKRRPAVRGAFFAILKSAATLLMAEDKKFPVTLKLMDQDAIKEGYGIPSPVKKVTARKKERTRG